MVLMVSLFFFIAFVSFSFPTISGLCEPWKGNCIELYIRYCFFIFWSPTVFVFSLITYFLSENIFRAWFRFTVWFVPLSMFLIFLAPEYSTDWMYRVEKGSVAVATSGIFSLVSTLIITVQYLWSRR